MSNKSHILIVDDDIRILQLLKQFFIQNGFLVSTVATADEAASLLKEFEIDLIILDVMMPKITGLDFAKTIRKANYQMPIVMLTALDEPSDRVAGLESGANDYLGKPFEPKELLLRVNNLINYQQNLQKQQETIEFGPNSYNIVIKEFLQHGQYVHLSTTEDTMLNILIQQQGQVISREQLAVELGNINMRSVDVQIVRLRNKIEANPKEPKYLKTIRNQGYVLLI